jgi:hypothetical protein
MRYSIQNYMKKSKTFFAGAKNPDKIAKNRAFPTSFFLGFGPGKGGPLHLTGIKLESNCILIVWRERSATGPEVKGILGPTFSFLDC